MQIARLARMRLSRCVSGSPLWSTTLRAPVDASRLSEPEGRPSVCASLTRRERTPLALASCAGSRFRETNHEFVQSNECEPVGVGRVLQAGGVMNPLVFTLGLYALVCAGAGLGWVLCAFEFYNGGDV